jgi:hypothetical protein
MLKHAEDTLDGTNGDLTTGTSPQVENAGDAGDKEVSGRARFDQEVASMEIATGTLDR